MFVVIEGLDASGKHTQSTILATQLRAQLFSFPRYETMVGGIIERHLKNSVTMMERHSLDSSDIRIDGDTVFRTAPEDPIVFQCLMVADKLHAAPAIAAATKTGAVVCDRWIPSAICYGEADGIDREWLTHLHAFLPQADLNIFLDVTPAEALRRRTEARDRYERDREKQEKVRINYQKMWATGGDRYVIIDGDGGGSDQAAIDVVAERVWEAVLKTWHASLRR